MRFFAIPLLLALWATAQDAAPAEPEFCAKYNKCHSEHEKEKVKCPRCNRNSIPKNDACCGGCANKEKICAHCGKYKPGTTPPVKRAAARNIDEAIERIKADDIRKLLMHVAADDKAGRLAGSPEHTKLTDEYAEIYKKAGLKPGAGGGYIQPVDVRGRASRNVVAVLEGEKKQEFVIYGAHSDHIGTVGNGPPGQQLGGAAGGDNIFNGADDNGSGTVAVLTVARVLGESGLKPKRSIMFINWTGEEWGMIGSKAHARSVPKESLAAVLNTDMLTRYSSHGSVEIHGVGTEAGNEWEELVQRTCSKYGVKCNLHPETRVSGGDSDHSSYRDIGVPCMFWWTGMHADYHKVTDSPDKADYAGMEKVIRAVALTVWELANTDKRWPFQNR
jgi:hypothetical protein